MNGKDKLHVSTKDNQLDNNNASYLENTTAIN